MGTFVPESLATNPVEWFVAPPARASRPRCVGPRGFRAVPR